MTDRQTTKEPNKHDNEYTLLDRLISLKVFIPIIGSFQDGTILNGKCSRLYVLLYRKPLQLGEGLFLQFYADFLRFRTKRSALSSPVTCHWPLYKLLCSVFIFVYFCPSAECLKKKSFMYSPMLNFEIAKFLCADFEIPMWPETKWLLTMGTV